MLHVTHPREQICARRCRNFEAHIHDQLLPSCAHAACSTKSRTCCKHTAAIDFCKGTL